MHVWACTEKASSIVPTRILIIRSFFMCASFSVELRPVVNVLTTWIRAKHINQDIGLGFATGRLYQEFTLIEPFFLILGPEWLQRSR